MLFFSLAAETRSADRGRNRDGVEGVGRCQLEGNQGRSSVVGLRRGCGPQVCRDQDGIVMGVVSCEE